MTDIRTICETLSSEAFGVVLGLMRKARSEAVRLDAAREVLTIMETIASNRSDPAAQAFAERVGKNLDA